MSDLTGTRTKEQTANGPVHWGNPNDTVFFSGAGFYIGQGVPSASIGSGNEFYFRLDGTAGTRIYHKEAGVWVGIV